MNIYAPLKKDSLKVLLVDDEENILRACKRILRKEAYSVESTSDPYKALEMVQNDDFALIISDQRMPQMEGTKLLEQVKEISPDTVRVILTGYADIQAAIEAINQGSVYQFLTKPWDDKGFILSVRQAIDQYALECENRRLTLLNEHINKQLKDLNLNLEQKVIERTKQVSKLHDSLKESFLGAVDALGELGETFSSVMGSHSNRVMEICSKITQNLGLSEQEAEQILVAARLHDLGKVGLPEGLLSKSYQNMSQSEKDEWESHAVFGETLIKKIPYFEKAAYIVRHHHENFDGSGFPDGLKAQKIPLGSRILAVVDAYDKLINSKENFDSVSSQQALEIIQQQSPQKFDPDMVLALRGCVQNFKVGELQDTQIEIFPRDLEPGMILARDLTTAQGVLILKKDSSLDSEVILKIQRYHQSNPFLQGIIINRL